MENPGQTATNWSTNDLLVLHDLVTSSCRAVMGAKNHDYSGAQGVDPFRNFKTSAQTAGDTNPVKGILHRIADKLARIRTFVEDGELKVSQETYTDAWMDIVNYCILGLGIMLEQEGKDPSVIAPHNPSE